jgi:hypothetical protein
MKTKTLICGTLTEEIDIEVDLPALTAKIDEFTEAFYPVWDGPLEIMEGLHEPEEEEAFLHAVSYLFAIAGGASLNVHRGRAERAKREARECRKEA